jgi:hypothetical protein
LQVITGTGGFVNVAVGGPGGDQRVVPAALKACSRANASR